MISGSFVNFLVKGIVALDDSPSLTFSLSFVCLFFVISYGGGGGRGGIIFI